MKKRPYNPVRIKKVAAHCLTTKISKEKLEELRNEYYLLKNRFNNIN